MKIRFLLIEQTINNNFAGKVLLNLLQNKVGKAPQKKLNLNILNFLKDI